MDIKSNELFATITVEDNREDILFFHILNVVNDEELQRFFPGIAKHILNKAVIASSNITPSEIKLYDTVACIIVNLQRDFEAREGKQEKMVGFHDNELDLLFKFARLHLSGHERKATSIWRKFIQEVNHGDFNNAQI